MNPKGNHSFVVPFLLWRRGEWTSCLHEWTFDDESDKLTRKKANMI